MATTPNGFAVLRPTSNRLTRLKIPGTPVHVTGRNDQLGFVVVFWLSWWNDIIEPLVQADTGVYSFRANTTAKAFWSEHSGAAAADARWSKHPQGVPISATFTAKQIRLIRRAVRYMNRMAKGHVMDWGGEWPTHPGSTAKTDGMHGQFVRGRVLYLTKRLAKTGRGKRVLKANPHLIIAGVTTK